MRVVAFALAACLLLGATGQCITRDTIIANANSWLANTPPYCECICPQNIDGYRCDCSGFVSYTWELGAPGYTTFIMLNIAHQIDQSQLEAGDAMLNVQEHVVLFDSWVDSSMTSYYGYEQIPQDDGIKRGNHSVSKLGDCHYWAIPYPYWGDAPGYIPVRLNNVCPDCQPNCFLRNCGTDSCTGNCGTCLWGNGCSPTGRCTSEVRQLVALKNSADMDELVYVSAFWGIVHNNKVNGTWAGQQVLNSPDSQGTEVAAIRNIDGRLEAFYVWGDGVHHNWETSPGGPWSGDVALSSFVGDEVAAHCRSDGQVMVITSFGGDMFYQFRAPGSDGWSTTQKMTGWALDLAIAENQNGLLEVFYPSVYYGIGHNVQTGPNGSDWSSEAALCSGCVGSSVSATLTFDGRLNVIWCNPNDHYIYQAWQTTPGSTSYTGGFKLSAPAEFVHATTNINGTLVVMFLFMNQPFVLYQDAATNWMPQVDLSSPTPMTSLVTTKDADGTIHAYGVGTDHVVYTAQTLTADPSRWTAFAAVGGWACDYQCFGDSSVARLDPH